MVQGGFTPNKSDAKKLAAFKCCEILYEKRLLTENLKSRLDEGVYDKLSLGHIFDFREEKDPVIKNKLQRIVVSKPKTEKAKQRLLYPLTTLNPFKYHYQEERNGVFVGYLYKLEFNRTHSDQKIDGLPKTCSLGFVYFNDKLDKAQVQVDLPKDDQGKVTFKLVPKRYCFGRAEYEKFIRVSRFMDATVRSWDVNYFEWLTGQKTNTKNPLYRKRKTLIGMDFEDVYDGENGNPIFSFYVQLDNEGQVLKEMSAKVLNYIEKMTKRYEESNLAVELKQKMQIDKSYLDKFKQNPEMSSKQLIQSSLTFNKYIVNNYWSVKKRDLSDCKNEGDETSLNLRIITSIEPNYEYIVRTDDYVLEMKSLGKYSQKLLKGEGHQNAREMKLFKKSDFGVLGEFVEYPFEVGILMELHQFRLALANIRDHLRVIHFRDEFLVNLEKDKSGSGGLTWEYLDLENFENNMRDVGQLILETIPFKEVSECSVLDVKEVMDDDLKSNFDMEEARRAGDIETMSQFFMENEKETDKIFSERISIEELKLALSTKEYNVFRRNCFEMLIYFF